MTWQKEERLVNITSGNGKNAHDRIAFHFRLPSVTLITIIVLKQLFEVIKFMEETDSLRWQPMWRCRKIIKKLSMFNIADNDCN